MRDKVRPGQFIQALSARPRLIGCILLSAFIFLATPGRWILTTRLLIAWNAGAWLYLGLSLALMSQATQEAIAARASAQDVGRFAQLILGSLAATASLGAIAVELAGVKTFAGEIRAAHIALSAATIVGAWLFIHMIFAQHYAHEYFLTSSAGGPWRRGLQFPAHSEPDYFDFLYFSYTIGVASQTADVTIASKAMRHVALAHSIISFFFNAVILALTINIAAGLF